MRQLVRTLKHKISDTAVDAICVHLVRYFFMSERDYMEELPRPTIDLKPYFDRAGVEVPFSTREGEGTNDVSSDLTESARE